ncbi:histidinol dehydrogenase [Ornithinimicrobium sp. LYQ92]|uniref:histidinol dehydrogenase n=1 Tax=Serinicoccus sp. LYQ92 TaxID=3378798 RepID=UPI0038524AD9
MATSIKTATHARAAGSSTEEVTDRVREIITAVRERGDDAVREYSEKFDRWSPPSFILGEEEISAIVSGLPQQVLDDITFVQTQVRNFASAQLATMSELEVETMPGVFLGHRHIPVEAAGSYIPGGRYPLTASAHMTIVTAKVAGVDHVTAATPPIQGEIPPATIAAMHAAGADQILVLGGVQAVAAMAHGTETIRPVNMLAGPGNAFVAEAKRQLFGQVGIDLFAGPTEVLVVADATADPFTVAVDLLSQAEHGPDSPAVLITTDRDLAVQVQDLVEKILVDMPTRDVAGPAWRDHGRIVVADDEDEMWALADAEASEHVQILTADPRQALDRMRNFGALFLGEQTCVSYGDKVIGTNHVLPTMGAARYTGGLWVGKYLKTVTYQEVRDPASSAELGRICGRASRVERFEGHARSGDIRAWRHGGDQVDWIDAVRR